MKICMLVDSWTPVWGGGPAHVWEISSRLVKNHNCQIDILVPNLVGNKKYPPEEKYLQGRLRILRLGPKFVFPNLLGRVIYLTNSLYFILNTPSYDVYHSHYYSTSLFLPLVKLVKRNKIAMTLHGKGVNMLGGGLLNTLGIVKLLNYLILYRIPYDVLFTVAKSSITKKVAAKKLVVIGNGVDVEKFDKVKARRNPKIFKILWVGRFDPVKGLPHLIYAIAQLRSKYAQIRLTLVGEGQERKNIEKLVDQNNLQKVVSFKSFLTGTPLIKEYKSSNLFVLPSLSEGFPVVLLEAAAAKLPVVASNVGDINQVLNGNFFPIEAGDIEGLIDKITEAVKSSRVSKFIPKNYELAKKYSWDAISSDILNVLS